MQLQDINSLGQGLIQTAAKGTSTKKLEEDLEEVNTKWNTLNKKVICFLLPVWLVDLCFWVAAISDTIKRYWQRNESFILTICYSVILWWVKGCSLSWQVTSIFTMWSADCRAFSPAARSPVALWAVPGCSGVTAQLVDWHGGARGQSKTSIGGVQSGQGTDTRAESKPASRGAST